MLVGMSRAILRVLPLLGLVVATACARVAPEQQIVADIADALGGEDRVEAARLVTLEGTGRQFNLGQDMRPGLASQIFAVSAFTRQIDLSGERMRTTLTRTPEFTYFQGPQAQTQIQGIDGQVAYGGSDAAKLVRTSNAAVADRRAERFHHPLTVVSALLSATPPPFTVRTAGAERLLDVTTEAGVITMAIGADARPLRIESGSSNANLGDVVLSTTFSDYVTANGWTLPTRLTTRVDAFTTGDYTVTTTVAESGAITTPDTLTAATAPAPPAVNVTVQDVAPGVWFLNGQSHHSAVVAFKDRLVLIEAPQSEARSLAVIARARELRPGTPLTHLVMTHHHFDHSSGLRAAVAEGLTVVTHEGNEAFVQEMAARPFTRMPDALEIAKKPVSVQPVPASFTLTDGTRTMVLHHLAGNPHTDTLLMAWLPKERILIQADAFSPGDGPSGSYHPYAANLLEHIERLKLNVDRIVPLHGSVVTLKDLVAVVRPPS